MSYGSLSINGKVFETGECRCHGRLDFNLTSQGSLKIVTNPEECISNRIWMYMATKKGERLDPKLGCCLHEYLHKPMTGSVLKALEADFKYELKAVFPEARTVTVMVYKIDQKSVRIYAQIDYSKITIEIGKDQLKQMNDMVRMTMAELGFKALWRSRS